MLILMTDMDAEVREQALDCQVVSGISGEPKANRPAGRHASWLSSAAHRTFGAAFFTDNISFSAGALQASSVRHSFAQQFLQFTQFAQFLRVGADDHVCRRRRHLGQCIVFFNISSQ